MLMSVVERAISGLSNMPVYPELAGKRVLITGVSRRTGVDLASAFAEHKTRLIINFADECPEMLALSEIMAQQAADLRVYHDALATAEGVTRFIQTAAKIHGGLDAVINFMHLAAGEIAPSADFSDVEEHVAAKLLAPCLISRIAANRMALTWSQGVVLNIVTMDHSQNNADIAIAGVTKAALTTMTRKQAEEWSDKAVRVNAVTPKMLTKPKAEDATAEISSLASQSEIAALALYLTSERGAKLTGHIFDADSTTG